MNKPKLSIIIPVYNVEKYIEHCLDSIIEQTYKDLEIICINDFSSDNSVQIVQKYINNYPQVNIKLIQNDIKKGPGACRNMGIDLALGKYIHFVDSDDFMAKDTAYETLVSLMEKYSIEVLEFNNLEYDNNKNRIVTTLDKLGGFPHKEDMLKHVLSDEERQKCYFNLMPFCWDKMYKTSFLTNNKIKFPEDIYFEDHVFTDIVSLTAKKIYITDDNFYVYRTSVENSIMSNLNAKCESAIKKSYYSLQFIKENNLWNNENIKYKFIISHIINLIDFYLVRINDYKNNRLLFSKIIQFINSLNLTKEEYKTLKKIHPYTYYLMKDILLQDKTTQFINYFNFCNIPLLTYIDKTYEKLWLLFNSIPLYRIAKKPNRTLHFLFGFLPLFKLKYGDIFLFTLFKIRIFSFRSHTYYEKNHKYAYSFHRQFLYRD